MNGEGEDRIEVLRTRIHKLADTVQTHEGTLIEHKTVIPILRHDIDILRAECATRESVSDAFKVVALPMESTTKEYTLKLKGVEDKLDPIQRGIYWVVGLVLVSVLGAILTLVLQTAK